MKNVITPILNCYSNQRKVNELSKELKRQKLFLNKKYKHIGRLNNEITLLKRKLFITEIRLNKLIDVKTLQ